MKYKSRKFGLCVASFIAVTVGLFTNFLNGSEFIAGITLCLTSYGIQNVMEKKNSNKELV